MTAAAVPELVQAGSKKLLAVLLLMVIAAGICVGWEYTFSRASAQSVIIGILGLTAVLFGRIFLLEKEFREESDQQYRRKISRNVQSALLVCVILSILAEK